MCSVYIGTPTSNTRGEVLCCFCNCGKQIILDFIHETSDDCSQWKPAHNAQKLICRRWEAKEGLGQPIVQNCSAKESFPWNQLSLCWQKIASNASFFQSTRKKFLERWANDKTTMNCFLIIIRTILVMFPWNQLSLQCWKSVSDGIILESSGKRNILKCRRKISITIYEVTESQFLRLYFHYLKDKPFTSIACTLIERKKERYINIF